MRLKSSSCMTPFFSPSCRTGGPSQNRAVLLALVQGLPTVSRPSASEETVGRSGAFLIRFLELRRSVRLLLHHNRFFVTMWAPAQELRYFRLFQVAQSRGVLDSLRYLHKAKQGGALCAGYLFVEHHSASFHSHKRRSSVFAVQALCEFRKDNRRRQ